MKELLKRGLTCCIFKSGKEIFSSNKKGIAPLISLIESHIDATDSVVYDKTVGKAAALLHMYFGAREVHADIISRNAVEVFNASGMKVFYNVLVENILNRKKDAVCSFERLVEDISAPSAAYEVLKAKVESIHTNI